MAILMYREMRQQVRLFEDLEEDDEYEYEDVDVWAVPEGDPDAEEAMRLLGHDNQLTVDDLPRR